MIVTARDRLRKFLKTARFRLTMALVFFLIGGSLVARNPGANFWEAIIETLVGFIVLYWGADKFLDVYPSTIKEETD